MKGLRFLQRFQGHGGIALLGDQFRRIVGRELIDKEKVGGGKHVAQQLDAFPNQRRDLLHSAAINVEPCIAHNRQQSLAQLLYRHRADVLGVHPLQLGAIKDGIRL